MITDTALLDMRERAARGEALSAEESLALVWRVHRLESELTGMDSLYNTLSMQAQARQEEIRAVFGRLRYTMRQLEKEANGKNRLRPEHSRFFRIYDTIADVLGQGK